MIVSQLHVPALCLCEDTSYPVSRGTLSPVSQSVSTSPTQSLSVLQCYYFLPLYSVLTAQTAKYVKVDTADIVTG